MSFPQHTHTHLHVLYCAHLTSAVLEGNFGACQAFPQSMAIQNLLGMIFVFVQNPLPCRYSLPYLLNKTFLLFAQGSFSAPKCTSHTRHVCVCVSVKLNPHGKLSTHLYGVKYMPSRAWKGRTNRVHIHTGTYVPLQFCSQENDFSNLSLLCSPTSECVCVVFFLWRK